MRYFNRKLFSGHHIYGVYNNVEKLGFDWIRLTPVDAHTYDGHSK